MPTRSLHAIAHGRVQGVGYRYFVLRRARALGLSGYTRNLADGTVEVYAEGALTELETLRRALEQGPEWAVVERVDARFGEARGKSSEFHLR